MTGHAEPEPTAVAVWVDSDGDAVHVRRFAVGLTRPRALLTVTEEGVNATVLLPDDPAELDTVLARIRAAALGQFQEET